MLRWSSSSATWLWQPLSAVFARHTFVAFWCFDTFHNHEAITTLSPMPGQAALREESGCSPRKALPGKRRADVLCAIQDTKRLLDDDAAWLSLLQGWGVKTCSQNTWQLWFSYLVFLFLHVVVFWFFEVGRRAAAAPGVCHRRSRVGELPRHTPQSQ